MAFLATIDIGSFAPTNPIVFDLPLINPGNHYDPTTGIYTVPIDAIYQFIFQYRTLNDNSADAFLEVDGDRVILINLYITAFIFEKSKV